MILWDSGKIGSGQSQHVKYEGLALYSRQAAYWKVRVWDQDNKLSEWSVNNRWQVGLLNKEDWDAKWIAISEDRTPDSPETGPAPYFRKEFKLNKPIKSATVLHKRFGLL